MRSFPPGASAFSKRSTSCPARQPCGHIPILRATADDEKPAFAVLRNEEEEAPSGWLLRD